MPFLKAGSRSYTLKPVVPVKDAGALGSLYVPAQFMKSSKVYGVVSNRPRDGVFNATGLLTIAKGK